jgi:L-amino acid N-acyltransferase YncA
VNRFIAIRPLEERDREAVHAIVNAVIAAGDAFMEEAPLDLAAFDRWLCGYRCGWVAEQQGRIAGACVLRPNHSGRGAHIANAAYMVDPAFRGRGIGRALGEHSILEAKRLGFRAMQFNAVVASNAAAVATWRSLGFAVVGTIPCAFRGPKGGYDDLLIMHRGL